ncbi:ribonuclease III domain-containing protein [Mycena belliarum]|uniref:Ribonuclease III domain-containing protein n=1 Tax=Mycena belliarum TaxID=1033014 RepID=A0AAD6XJR3_9AGAR|nr:ribonuclease III domain-containing protein [Mycena belliae]
MTPALPFRRSGTLRMPRRSLFSAPRGGLAGPGGRRNRSPSSPRIARKPPISGTQLLQESSSIFSKHIPGLPVNPNVVEARLYERDSVQRTNRRHRTHRHRLRVHAPSNDGGSLSTLDAGPSEDMVPSNSSSPQYLNLLHDVDSNSHLLPTLPNIRREDILSRVFAHPSYPELHEEHPDQMQKLAFLGDSVLGLVVTKLIIEILPDVRIGPSTIIRHGLVCNSTLAKISAKYKLHDRIRVLPTQSNIRLVPNVQADVFEAYIGGLYEDQGLASAATWLEDLFRPHITDAYNSLRGSSSTKVVEAAETSSHSTGPGSRPDTAPIYMALFNWQLQTREMTVEWVYAHPPDPDANNEIWWSAKALVGEDVFHGIGRTKSAARGAAAKEALLKMGVPFEAPT